MSDLVARYVLGSSVGRGAILRSGTLLWYEDRSLVIADGSGTRTLMADWEVSSIEVTPDGEYALAVGDDAKRAVVWEVRSGRRMFDFAGNLERRQSLRAGLGVFGGELYGFFYTYSKNVSVIRVRDSVECGWLATTGAFWYHLTRLFPLNDQWLAIVGYHDGESRDTALALPALAALHDPMVLYGALYEQPSVREWGYRAGIGPVGGRSVVFFRDPEWEDDEPPDDPSEAFRGLVVWDLDQRQVVQRISYNGAIEREPTIGADAEQVALTLGNHSLDVVSRRDGRVSRVDAVALDPYRMEAARQEERGVAIVKLSV